MLEIKLTGSSYEIGRGHGERLRDEIGRVLSCYYPLWNLSKAGIQKSVEGYKRAVQNYFPHLSEEIKGMAEGSGIDEFLIYAINARTELLAQPLHECTCLGVPSWAQSEEYVILAQNWDWLSSLVDLSRVIDINSQIKTFIEPGMVGKIGINKRGVGVCLNFLDSYKINKEGVPVHILLRGILECSSTEKALHLIKHIPRAASANYLIADSYNLIYNLETTIDGIATIMSSKFITHTNVYNSKGESCVRQKIFSDCIERHLRVSGKMSLNDIKDCLHADGVIAPSNSGRRYGGVLDFFDIETLNTVIFNLTKKRMMVSNGARFGEFVSFGL